MSDVPSGDLIDVNRLDSWLGDKLPGEAEQLEVERMGEATGAGNALFDIRRAEHRWVLRRPPLVPNAPGANDMLREYRVLTALNQTSVPHPETLLLCDDPEVIGAPFFIMQRIDGFTPVAQLPPPFDTDPSARHGIGIETADALAELALVDWRAIGLEGFGKPDGFLERQVGRWLWQLDGYKTREIPEVDFVASWLEDHRPTMGEPGIMHGDYSLFNVMFHHGAPARLAAIIDWDTCTIGDPLMDIGHLLSRWQEPGEEPVLGRSDTPDRKGFATRAELAERYARKTGRDLSHIEYYKVLSLFKLACILEGHYYRALTAAGGKPPENGMGETVPRLFRNAARMVRAAG